MQIGLEVLMTRTVILVQLSFWVNAWCCESVRNKVLSLYQLLKKSILLMLPVVHKFDGRSKP